MYLIFEVPTCGILKKHKGIKLVERSMVVCNSSAAGTGILCLLGNILRRYSQASSRWLPVMNVQVVSGLIGNWWTVVFVLLTPSVNSDLCDKEPARSTSIKRIRDKSGDLRPAKSSRVPRKSTTAKQRVELNLKQDGIPLEFNMLGVSNPHWLIRRLRRVSFIPAPTEEAARRGEVRRVDRVQQGWKLWY